MTTLKGNIDSKLREIVPHEYRSEYEDACDSIIMPGKPCNCEHKEIVSQLKQLINEFSDEVIGEDEKPDMYTHWEENNTLRSEMRERKEGLLK